MLFLETLVSIGMDRERKNCIALNAIASRLCTLYLKSALLFVLDVYRLYCSGIDPSDLEF